MDKEAEVPVLTEVVEPDALLLRRPALDAEAREAIARELERAVRERLGPELERLIGEIVREALARALAEHK
jgi:hypothetical protein